MGTLEARILAVCKARRRKRSLQYYAEEEQRRRRPKGGLPPIVIYVRLADFGLRLRHSSLA
jgi:hypothetical protein